MWKLFKREVHHACKAVMGWGLLCGMVGVSPALAQEVWQDSLRSSRGVSLTMPYSDMALSARFIGPAVSDKDWYIWCFSPIWGKDGKVHAFCSRWPAAEGMEGWTGANAEIAHYVADRPEGPFRYVATVMKTSMFPDPATMSAPHNPRLEYVDGKYVLLYICQNPSKEGTKQRVGMMVADNLEGPWRFAGDRGGIMVEASDDPGHWTYQAAIGADNPAFLKIEGKYYIYYKCGTPEHMKAKYGYAVSDKLEGPYEMCDAPITDNVSYLEDAQAFSVDGKYYLLTTDNLGGNSGGWGYLILWESENGKSFRRADAQIAMGTVFDYWKTPADREELMKTPGLFVRCASGKLERPAVLMKKGKPAYLYGVADVNVNGGKVSEPYVFSVKWKVPKRKSGR